MLLLQHLHLTCWCRCTAATAAAPAGASLSNSKARRTMKPGALDSCPRGSTCRTRVQAVLTMVTPWSAISEKGAERAVQSSGDAKRPLKRESMNERVAVISLAS